MINVRSKILCKSIFWSYFIKYLSYTFETFRGDSLHFSKHYKSIFLLTFVNIIPLGPFMQIRYFYSVTDYDAIHKKCVEIYTITIEKY